MSNRIVLFFLIAYWCTGCAVVYKESELVNENGLTNYQFTEGCVINYWIKNNPEDVALKTDPLLDDYRLWARQVINELGCEGTENKDVPENLMVVEITDNYVFGGAGVGIIAALTLYIIPLKDTSPHRTYTIYNEQALHRVKVNSSGWYGWIFLPFYPLSYWNYEKGIFKDSIRSFMDANGT